VKSSLATDQNIRALFDVLNEQNVREIVVESVLSLLWRLSTPREDVEDDDIFPTSPDVVEAVILAMDLFDSSAIREAGCGILANMSMRKSFPSELIQPLLVSMNGFLMDVESVDKGLATCALHSICNMLEHPASKNVSLPVYQQLIETVLGLMNQYPHSEELIEFACLTIAHAAGDDHAVKDIVMQLGGFDLVRAAFEEFVTRKGENPSLEVKDACLCAIATLTGCQAGAEVVMNSGLLDILLALLAVETDRDFAVILEIIAKNTRNGIAGRFASDSQDVLQQQPHLLAQLVKESSGDADVASLFQRLRSIGQPVLGVAAGSQEGFSSVITALEQYPDSAAVQEHGCAILAELFYYIPVPIDSLEGAFWSPQNQHEVLQVLGRAMDSHRDDMGVQSNGCLIILNLIGGLSTSGGDRHVINSMIERPLKAILECLQIHGSSRQVQKSGMCALSALIGFVDQNVLRPWIALIVQQLYVTLHYTSDSEIQLLALDVLILLQGLYQGTETIGSSSNVETLLELLGSDTYQVLGRSSAILAYLMENDFMLSSLLMESPNTIQILLSCMSSNQADLQIKVNICSVLDALVNFADADAISQIHQHGGVCTLCTGISLHPASENLAMHSCNVLSSAIPCMDPGTISTIREPLKECLIGIMDRHVECPEVLTSVFDAIWACCQQDELIKNIMIDETHISVILSAMQLNLGFANLQRSGCSLLWLLSSGAGNGKELIGSCGGIPTVVNAMLAHNESTVVQKEGLIALKNLAISSCNKPIFAETGVKDAVICSLWINCKDPQVISIGLSALNNIAVDSEKKSVAKMSEQTLLLVTAAMSLFPLDENVQKNACFFIKSCSYLPANLDLMREKREQLIPLLFRAADTFPQQCKKFVSSVVSKLQ